MRVISAVVDDSASGAGGNYDDAAFLPDPSFKPSGLNACRVAGRKTCKNNPLRAGGDEGFDGDVVAFRMTVE